MRVVVMWSGPVQRRARAGRREVSIDGFSVRKIFQELHGADTSELVIIKARAAGSSAFTLYYMFYALSDRASGKKLFVPRGLYGNLLRSRKKYTLVERSRVIRQLCIF